jgi:hypothetical protein
MNTLYIKLKFKILHIYKVLLFNTLWNVYWFPFNQMAVKRRRFHEFLWDPYAMLYYSLSCVESENSTFIVNRISHDAVGRHRLPR